MEHAAWIPDKERNLVLQRLAEDEASKAGEVQHHHLMGAFRDGRVWILSLVYFCGIMGFYAFSWPS